VRHVPHLVAIAEPDDVGKVVLDYSEVIAVITDVCRQEQCVAPAENELFASIGRLPKHFQRQLIGLDDLWRLGEPRTYLGEEGEISVRSSPIIDERRIRELRGAARGRSLD
jgi:hypothetical protein